MASRGIRRQKGRGRAANAALNTALLRGGALATEKKIAAISLALLLASAVTIAAAAKLGWFASPATPTIASAAPQSGSGLLLAKEYVYAGARLVATEEGSGAGSPGPGSAVFDFEPDQRTEIGYYRAGTWGILKSSQGYGYASAQSFGWGGAGYAPFTADFDGDDKADVAYVGPASGAQTYSILKSTTSYDFSQALFVSAGWSSLGDTPVVGHFDNDGLADPSIWRSSQGLWILQKSSANYAASFVSWGQSGDIPIVADFDADGQSDIGYYRGGTWGVLKSSRNYGLASAQFFSWGGAGLQPVVADFDGDRKADIAYMVPPTGGQSAAYAILKSSANYSAAQALFVSAGYPSLGDTPVVGDYDGDRKADPGIWRASQGVWIIPMSSANYAGYIFSQWGQAGDTPIYSRTTQY